jgi:hypothetical protein
MEADGLPPYAAAIYRDFRRFRFADAEGAAKAPVQKRSICCLPSDIMLAA